MFHRDVAVVVGPLLVSVLVLLVVVDHPIAVLHSLSMLNLIVLLVAALMSLNLPVHEAHSTLVTNLWPEGGRIRVNWIVVALVMLFF